MPFSVTKDSERTPQLPQASLKNMTSSISKNGNAAIMADDVRRNKNSSSSSKHKKTVRILPEAQVLGGDRDDNMRKEGMSDRELVQAWWQADEYQGSKASTRSMCQRLRQLGEGSGALTDAYHQACSIAASGLDDMETIHAAQSLIPNEGLLRHCQRNDIRGLERWLCRTYAVGSNNDQIKVKQAVFFEQARQFVAQEQDEEALARMAQEASRKARAFATLLGQADAAVVKHQSELEGACCRRRHSKKQEPVFGLYAAHITNNDDPVSSDDECSQGDVVSTSPIVISINTDS